MCTHCWTAYRLPPIVKSSLGCLTATPCQRMSQADGAGPQGREGDTGLGRVQLCILMYELYTCKHLFKGMMHSQVTPANLQPLL